MQNFTTQKQSENQENQNFNYGSLNANEFISAEDQGHAYRAEIY